MGADPKESPCHLEREALDFFKQGLVLTSPVNRKSQGRVDQGCSSEGLGASEDSRLWGHHT